MDAEDAREWAKYIDWLLDLPPAHNSQVWQELYAIEMEKQMPYVTSFEKIGYERGLYKAIELGLQLRFGSEGLGLMADVHQKHDLAFLDSLCEAIKSAGSLDDIRRLLS